MPCHYEQFTTLLSASLRYGIFSADRQQMFTIPLSPQGLKQQTNAVGSGSTTILLQSAESARKGQC